MEELLFASDSRLRSYAAGDIYPKLAIALCGQTRIFHLMLLQLSNVISLHRASKSRKFDLREQRGHLIRVLQYMAD